MRHSRKTDECNTPISIKFALGFGHGNTEYNAQCALLEWTPNNGFQRLQRQKHDSQSNLYWLSCIQYLIRKSKLITERFEKSKVKLSVWLVKGSWIFIVWVIGTSSKGEGSRNRESLLLKIAVTWFTWFWDTKIWDKLDEPNRPSSF